jgi:putative membrane-bound dehydrogenase-like protein
MLLGLAAALGAATPARAADGSKITVPRPQNQEGRAPSSFTIKPGFRLEVVASEALVSAPAAMAFDENGRLFVAEMRDFPNKQQQAAGRIRLLEDTDGDGFFDSSTIYADNLAWPSAIACYDGGVFVASTPDILYFKDLNGDGVADTKKIAFSGFGGTNTPGFGSLLTSFQWGMDNRIHGLAAGLGGAISAPGTAADLVMLRDEDFAFDPRSMALTPESGPGQSGLAFDLFGRRFVSSFSRPMRLDLLEARYIQRSPFFVAPAPLSRVVSPSAPLLVTNPEAVEAAATAAASGSRKAPASIPIRRWMTAARGLAIYRGQAFPTNYLNNAFIADSDAHVVHRVVLRDNGLEVVGARSPDESTFEFIESSDPSFHPTQIINSPDGVLYIADIQSGGDSGRILRVIPDSFRQSKPPQLAKAKPYDLVASMAQGNGWYQETAARLLYERRDSATVGLLTNMLSRSGLLLARLRALHGLDGQGSLNEVLLIQSLRDGDEHVREHGIALAEKFSRNGALPDALWNQLKLLVADPSLRVRYQLALTLGEIRRPEKSAVLRDVFARSSASPWMQPLVLSSAGQNAPDFFITLASDPAWRNDFGREALVLQVAIMIGAQGRLEEVTQVIDFLAAARFENIHVHLMLAALGEGLRRTGSSLALVDSRNRLRRFYEQTEELILNESARDPERIAALRLRAVSPYTVSGTGDFLQLLFGSNQSEAVQAAAITALGRYENKNIPDNVFARWRELSATPRAGALSSFLARTDRVPSVLTALEMGKIRAQDFSGTQINLLRTFPDPAISQRALRIFGPFLPQRPTAFASVKDALKLTGAPLRGRQTFFARCGACHGVASGPHPPDYYLDFTPASRERLLHAIVEPNAALRPSAAACTVFGKTGEIWVGRARNENKQSVTIEQSNGVEIVLPTANISSMPPQPWSIMPEGLENGLSPQDMADLMEYVISGPTLPSENPQFPSANDR